MERSTSDSSEDTIKSMAGTSKPTEIKSKSTEGTSESTKGTRKTEAESEEILENQFEDDILICLMNCEILNKICEILDSDDTWESVAPMMPGIEQKDVETCRKWCKKGHSPSKLLFHAWSAKGFAVKHMLQLFGICKMIRLMRMLKPILSEKYHKLEDNIFSTSTSTGIDYYAHITSQRNARLQSNSKRKEQEKSPQPPREASPLRVAIDGTLPVSYRELQDATNGFSIENMIGRGGYGMVYKGQLKGTGNLVAVKRIMSLSDGNNPGREIEKERIRQSLQELRTLARFRHDNILPIYAYSLEGAEPCLVYQFMANGSLDDRLMCKRGTKPLTWHQRRDIALGAARGLLFLHTFTKTPVIHGDVKSANILLDKHMEPKLGDFGLCRDGQIESETNEKSPLIASHIKGTLAYLPPEFISSRILTTKLDVYSFGIVLLELATGLRAYSDQRDPRGLVDYCLSFLIGKGEKKLVDCLVEKRTPRPALNDKQIFETLISLGLQSSCKDRMQRPSMATATQTIVHLEARTKVDEY